MAKAKKGRVITVDFEGMERGGGGLRVPEGDYVVKIKSAVHATSESSGNPMITVTFVGTEGKLKKKEFKDYFTLTKKSYWKLAGFLEALGYEVPDGKAKLNLDKWIGKEVGVTLTDEESEYKGKTSIRSRPSDYIDVDTVRSGGVDDEDEEEDDDEDEDTDDDTDDEDSDDDDEDEDLEEVDLDEL